jgi:hypothetical protein
MSISYEEALATLEAMFGEPWERDTLDSVLRHHKGHMENTVDQILRHGEKDPQILVNQLQAGIDPEQIAVNQDEMLARQLAQEARAAPRRAPAAAAAAAKKGRGTPTVLPTDFLRVPSAQDASTPGTQMDSDEALARMLQDELFTEELARNPDFAHLARGRPTTSGGIPTRNRTANGRTVETPRRPGDPPNIMGKISELGDNAKRRLQMLAAQFNANANRINPSQAGQAETANVAAGERRGLLDNDDDMELAARKDL